MTTSTHGSRHDAREDRSAEYIDSLKEQLSYLEMECTVLKNAKQNSKAHNSSNSSVVGAGHTRGTSVISSKSCVDDSISELTERCRQLEAEHRAEMNQREVQQDELLQEISDLRTEVEFRKEEQRLLRSRAEDIAGERTSSLEREVAHLSQELTEQQNAKEQLQAALAAQLRAEERYAHERKLRESIESELTEEVTRLREQLALAKSRVTNLEGSCGVDRVRLAELETKHTSFINETTVLQARTEAAEDNARQLNGELARSRNHLQKAQEKADALSEENDQLVETNAGLHETIRKLQHQLSGSAGRENDAKERCEEALRQASTQQVQYESMKIELEKTKEFMEGELTRHRHEVEAFADARARIDILENNLRSLTHSKDEVEAQRKRLEEHMSMLVSQVSSLRAHLDAARLETKKAEDRALQAEQARVWALQRSDEDNKNSNRCNGGGEELKVAEHTAPFDVEQFQHLMQSQIAATLQNFMKQNQPQSIQTEGKELEA